jgi:thymidylate synthase (FAD)
MHEGLTEEQIARRMKLYQLVEETYLAEISEDVKPQQARDLLMICQKTELRMTANAREWRHFFTMRADPPAHPKLRSVTCPLLREVRQRVPVLFDDVGEPHCEEVYKEAP